MKRLLLTVFLILAFGLMSQCTNDKALQPPEKSTSENDSTEIKTCDTLKPSFQQTIKPIFTNNCAQSGCHDQGTATAGYSLETYERIKDGLQNGQVLCSIKHGGSCSNMPRGSDKLSSEKIRKIECWTENGAPNN